jgi:hypothetical protein
MNFLRLNLWLKAKSQKCNPGGSASPEERYQVEEGQPMPMGFIQEWFGFNGWKELSTKGSVLATIAYRIVFIVGLAASIIVYSYASGGEDPSLLYIAIVGFVWFLMFQFMLNLVFVNGSR